MKKSLFFPEFYNSGAMERAFKCELSNACPPVVAVVCMCVCTDTNHKHIAAFIVTDQFKVAQTVVANCLIMNVGKTVMTDQRISFVAFHS